ncbi:MAG: exopolysaccharide biosynthesis polyprenyl glycosylphosphotransferase [Nitrospirota bacterium]
MFISANIIFAICSIVISEYIYDPIHQYNLKYLFGIFIAVFNYIICCYIYDIYNISEYSKMSDLIKNIILANILTGVLTCTAYFITSIWHRKVFILNSVMLLSFSFIWRLYFIRIMKSKEKAYNILMISNNQHKKELSELLRLRYHANEIHELDADALVKESKALNRLIDEAGKGKIFHVLIDYKTTNIQEFLNRIRIIISTGVKVYDFESVYEHLTDKVIISSNIIPLLNMRTISYMKYDIYKFRIKPIIDKIIAALILIILSPALLILIIIIILFSKTPVFFTQDRVGLNEKPFRIYKFRSMKTDKNTSAPNWTDVNDDRITPIGKIMRKYRIDEIPQLWNVLRGEMSLIGPRPEVPDFVNIFNSSITYYFMRHTVKPGITGWSQVKYKYAASPEEAITKLQYDLWYIKNMSFFIDLRIILETLKVVFIGRGAR